MKLNKRDMLYKQKRIYYVILIFILIGIFLGFIYPFILSKTNEKLLTKSITDYFNNISNNNYNTFNALKNSLSLNMITSLLIFILGFSIIGILIVIPILLYKGFILSFSFSSIVYVYNYKGLLGAILYVFPNAIVSLIIYILLGFYSINFSLKLFNFLFKKKKIDFNKAIIRYIKILCISILILILMSLYEVYILPVILKLFTKII